jgi:hypothetical protein
MLGDDMASSFVKDPDAGLDYKFDWAASTNGTGSSDWLDTDNSETISSHTVVADTGLTVDSSSLTDTNTSVTAWLSGGVDGTDYDVTCHIVTSASREDDRTITIKCREQ